MNETATQGFQLAPRQRRLWDLAPAVGPFVAECTVEIGGELHPPTLRAALQEVVRRHEILRTAFRGCAGLPVPLQVILESGTVRLETAAGASPGDPPAPPPPAAFDLARGELVHAELWSRSPSSHRLRLSLPALCCDAASLAPLIAQLAASYAALAGPAESLPPAMQYADAAGFFNDLLAAPETRDGQQQWQRFDPRRLARLRLPHEEAPGNGSAPFRPRLVESRCAGAGGEVAALAAELAVDAEAVLLAAWLALLARLTGSHDVVAGALHDGRSFPELRQAIGLYAGYLPIQAEAAPGASFASLAAAVAGELRRAREWQDFFVWPAGDGCFPFTFELLPAAASWRAGGLDLAITGAAACIDACRAGLLCRLAGADLVAAVRYDAAALSESAALLLARRFGALLAGVAHQGPHTALAELAVTDAEEERWLLENARGADDLADGLCLHQGFERQARRTPHAVAVEAGERRLTYGELDRLASRAACRLAGAGVRLEAVVAMATERSLEMVIGLLAILKAGAAILPLDLDFPVERLAAMLRDSRPALLLLTGARTLPAAAAAGVPRLHLASLLAAAEGADQAPAATPEVPLDALAYLIYTSGSTGQPKGVMVSHRAIANRIRWMHRALPLAADDRVLQKTPLSFDPALWEIFAPLWAGARAVLARPGGQQDAAYLAQTVAERGITVLQLVPSFLSLFIEEPLVAECRSLRRLFSGGEALPAAVARRCGERLAARLYNLYGPTEAAIDATWHPCSPDGERGPSVPIGRPLANLEALLLDASLRPVPFGAAGEIFLGGAGLARGYRGRPGQTAERFLPHPAGRAAGQRLYRTGDLARLLPDGTLEFIGRTDHQVKLRGQRIELGEIETALRRHPGVRDAVVALRGGRPESTFLAAYVVANGAPPAAGELRSFLRETLPEAMVPATLTVLAELPRSPNGKVDRGALPEPAPRAAAADGGAAPRTPIEELLAGIWSEVLGAAVAGVQEDFFALGGHSIAATLALSRIRQAFDVQMRIADFFERPTIAAQADWIGTLLGKAHGVEAPPIAPAPRGAPLPLSFPQQRIWLLDRLEPGNPAYNIPAVVHLTGALDLGAMARVFAEVVRRHEALRTVYAPGRPEPVQIVLPAAAPRLPRIDLGALDAARRGREARRLAAAEAMRSFDLARGPLLRIFIVRLGPADHLGLFTLHHIASDAWSAGILIREVAALYAAFSAGRPSPLAELPVQYADFAVWQRDWLRGAPLAAELDYWRRQLAGAPPAIELPTDRPRPPRQSFRGADLRFAIETPITAALRLLARQQGATLFIALLALLKALLHRLSGQPRIVVGSPIANRTRVEIEGLIGCFLNTLALHTDLAGDPPFDELLRRERRVALGAYAHQDLPFERLVEELNPPRDASRNPLFQVLFNLQNAPRAALRLPGLEIAAAEVGSQTEKFDLTLSIAEDADRMTGFLRFNTDLFDRSTMVRLLERFRQLAAAAGAAPERRLSALPYLLPGERAQVLTEWMDTAAAQPAPLTVHELFAQRAARSPAAPAVVAAAGEWTYAGLDRRVAELARRLARAGAAGGGERPIVLAAARGPEMAAALLAILRVGAVYVPLDARQPAARWSAAMERIRPLLLLASESVLQQLPAPGCPVVLLDGAMAPGAADHPGGGEEKQEREEEEEVAAGAGTAGAEDAAALTAGAPAARPRTAAGRGAAAERETAVLPEQLAYILHTSGSTGTPKGVMIAHRGVVNYLRYLTARWRIGPGDRVLNVTALTFDPSIRDLLAPLVSGACLVLPAEEEAKDPSALLAVIAERGVTCLLSVVPSLLGALALAAAGRAQPAVRLVLTCGEALTPADLARAQALFPAALVVNQYGPTEATMSQTYYAAPAPAADLGQSILPLGRPIPNARCFVLDAGLRPAGIGETGEIAIATVGLARGYLAAPDLTAERFVPDPFAAAAGARLYRTGDLGRWRADGNLEFLGRRDRQVKLRGLRIEMAEIEAALRRHPAVHQAAAMVREDRPGDARLAAYVVPRGAPAGARELRAWLQAQLPDYMVPGAVVLLDSLPLNRHGKLDHAALPAPPAGHGETAGYVAPESALEEVLAEIWCEVLGVERVGTRDSFFDLGGHSLLATQVIARVREVFEVEVPLRRIFAEPTVAALAAALLAGEPVPGRMEKIAAALQRVRAMSQEDLAEMLGRQEEKEAVT